MRAFRSLLCWVCVTACSYTDPSSLIADEAETSGVEFFESRIRPVLVEHCFACHSEEASKSNKLKGGLRLDSGAGILAGGDSGPMVNPENNTSGLLISALRHEDLQMPPDAKLPEAIIADFDRWIQKGTPVPADAEVQAKIETKGIDWTEARKAWAFQLPTEHAVPNIQFASWPKSRLDFFVLAELEGRGLKPVEAANKRDLIRRATLDLIGLPPTPDEVDSFVQDDAPNAFSIVIDRLLQSPHYGERWARYWLDLARYADDQGNSFLSPTPSAYLYRDWLVGAFNNDMPYDQFIRLQLAGDELPGHADDYVERLAGLGFQGLGPQFRKGAAGEEKAKADELEDRVDTLSRAFLGLTVSCARCHDHKFDPIPTRDYYSMAAAYNGAAWPERMLASPDTVKQFRGWEQQVQQQKADLERWTVEQGKDIGLNALESIDQYLLAAASIRKARQLEQTSDETAIAKLHGLDVWFLSRLVKLLDTAKEGEPAYAWRLSLDLAIATDEFDASNANQPWLAAKESVVNVLRKQERIGNPQGDPLPIAEALNAEEDLLLKSLLENESAPFYVSAKDALELMGAATRAEHASRQVALQELVSHPPPSGPTMPSVSGGGEGLRVFVRGNPLQLGEPASPGFLRILEGPQVTGTESEPKLRFTRLDLANSIASDQNPLTARVFVNRIWHYHFGRGIVSTLGNFGKNGSSPTHPDLLDTLAAGFMKSGWSIKSLHREIMLSATYQLSSEHSIGNLAIDPDNHFLWRMSPRRLDFEAWRDSMLAVAGKLDPTIGGPTLDPVTPAVKEVPGSDFFTRLVGRDLDDPTNGRRTLYCTVSRYAPHPTAGLFDFPEPNVASDLRNVTTIPQQQLFVLNSPFAVEMGRAFAQRLKNAASIDADRLLLAWKIAYGRSPDDRELQLALDFLEGINATDENKQLDRWEQLCHAILASNEFTFVP